MFLTKELYFSSFLIVLCFKLSLGYRKYYIEDECMPSSKKQKIILNLPATGFDSVGEIRSNRFGTYSRSERNCLLKLRPPDDYGVVLTILKIDFRNKDCDDFIEIVDSEAEEEKLCGYREYGLNKTYFSDEDLDVLYHTSGNGIGFNKGVRLIFTVTKLDSGECNSPDEFRCKNSHCIWAGVKCDGINNCGDASDESIWDDPQCRTYLKPYKNIFSMIADITPLAITAAIIGVASFVAVVVGMCICCCRADIKHPEKPILLRRYPDISNGGYIPLPGYNYGSTCQTLRHMQPVHSQVHLPAPMHPGWGNSNVPLVHLKPNIRYERPPPYDS